MSQITRAAAASLPHQQVADLYVDGAYVAAHATETIEVADPSTGEVWGRTPDCDATDVDAAVGAARQSFDSGAWRRMTAGQRAEVLLRAADEVEARAHLIAMTNTRENGSPVAETAGAAANAASILRYFATLAPVIDDEDVRVFPKPPSPGARTVVKRDPIGVCALIAPWNFPINLVVIKLAPALLAGCSVVIKPAPSTPLSIRYVVEALAAAGVPDGVVNVVTGGGQTGDLLVRHPQVDKVAFTGSTPVGRRIAAACGELLRPVTLELGGKSSAIVLPDADLELLGSRLVRSCLRNTGQTCYISTRILAPAERYEEVVEVVTRTIAEQRQGDPFDQDTVFGPLANRMQFDSVQRHLALGHEQGARVTTGGALASLPGELAGGLFIQPTVFADVTPDLAIAREEIFGPVLTVMKYDGVDEAIAIANNTDFGLGGIVFGGDVEAARAVAERVDSGSVGVNFFASNHSAPFGGRHDSGLGVEYGVEGLHAYLSFKSIHLP
ncbi:aldehyde dehydrogenase family protein [Luteococcus sp. OSA5]|uniref:aldehyde dehydrogenase family protein n=1 Tax=Luteococcus sp. OSA5 TaxID=3401630 RepID=UPI003B4312AB